MAPAATEGGEGGEGGKRGHGGGLLFISRSFLAPRNWAFGKKPSEELVNLRMMTPVHQYVMKSVAAAY